MSLQRIIEEKPVQEGILLMNTGIIGVLATIGFVVNNRTQKKINKSKKSLDKDIFRYFTSVTKKRIRSNNK